MRGVINKNNTKQDYIVIGVRRLNGNSGFELEFIAEDKENPNGKIVEKIFVANTMAIAMAKKILEKKKGRE